jgi:2-octaprenylphenol hydroxylase
MHYEITVVGGGMVGAALALGLLEAGFDVALIEGHAPEASWPRGQPGSRVSALNRAAQRLLTRLEVWPLMERLGVTPYRQMQVWDAQSRAEIHFDSAELGEPDLGHIVENRVTQLALWQRLEALVQARQPASALLCPAQLVGLELSDLAGPLLRLADGRSLRTRLVLAADGADSPLRHWAGIETLGWRYDHSALVTSVRLERGHGETARQVFLPGRHEVEAGAGGAILAFLPLAEDVCSIVWSCSAQQAAALTTLDEDAFEHELASASGQRLGPMRLCGPRAVFPLRLQHARDYVRPGLALLGDAAHAIHPLAGQGVNLGFQDVAALITALRRGRAAGRAPGHLRDLRAYERARKGENLGMMLAMDGFKRLFGSQHPVLNLGRGLGLNLANRLAPLNHALMRQALGLDGVAGLDTGK